MKNGKINFISKRKNKLKLEIFLLIYFIFLLLLKTSAKDLKRHLSILNDVDLEINMVVRKSKTILLSESYEGELPYKIIINEKEENFESKYYDLEEEKNNITLKFNTQISSFASMFKNLENILEINISNFDMSQITNMENMFYNCINLEYINLSNNNFSHVNEIKDIFYNCMNLKSLNLSNSDFSNIENTIALFYKYSNLISIDLYNSDFSNVQLAMLMFYDCNKLEFINLTKIKLYSLENIAWIFGGCTSLKSIDLSNLDLSNVKDASMMFYDCSKLEFINLTKTKLYSVENIAASFSGCTSLKSIDFSDSDLYNIKIMDGMFYGCKNLESINFGEINTSSTEDMSNLFYNCKSLKSINLSKFDTSRVIYMSGMFYGCSNLTSLDLTNFNISYVEKAREMFYGCSNLLYLDLSNFETLNLKYISYMFYGCKSLLYLNLYSFKLLYLYDMNNLFDGLPSYTIYCINDIYTENILKINNNNCSHPCFKKNSKLDLYNKTCTDFCIKNKLLYEYNNICYSKCPKGSLVNGSKCEKLDLIDMNKTIQGYYYDSKDEIYKQCFYSCKLCDTGGNYTNHNCIECKLNLISLNESKYEKNCYKKCQYYYYFDDLNDYYHCTEKEECPENYNKVILNKKKCTNDCKKDNIYQYEFENQCLEHCPENTFYNETYKICISYENSTNIKYEESENLIQDYTNNINTDTNLIYSSDDIEITHEVSINSCYDNCKECIEYSFNPENMKCLSCKDGFTMVFDTQNCIDSSKNPNYFRYLDYLYPCSSLSSNCYECEPYLTDYIDKACLTCEPGFIYNKELKRCEACNENEYPFIIENFDSCKDVYSIDCDLYITYCISLNNENSEIICTINNFDINNGTCLNINKNKIIDINWLNNNYPSYNVNKNDYLFIELTIDSLKRKLFFYNEDGRGIFNVINNTNEMIVESKRAYSREISSSIVLKVNNSDEYKYLLNFESYNNNLELIDIKIGQIFKDNLYNFLWIFDYSFLDFSVKPTINLLELNEENQFLIANFAKYRLDNKIVILYFIFFLEDTSNQNINIDSLINLKKDVLRFNNLDFNIYARFYFIQTKSGNLYLSFVSEKNELYYYDIQKKKEYYIYTLSNQMSFQKFLLIKEEIKFLTYYSNDKHLVFIIFETIDTLRSNIILEFKFKKYLPYLDDNDYTDVIFLSELRAVFILEADNIMTIFVLDFFNNYKHFMGNEYLININRKGIKNSNLYSLLFKYRNMLGVNFKNENGNGFILFGYYNSTDPKQILNVKKEGLFYHINLGNYLNIQTNIFDYQIKCIRIIEVPNINTSGLYLISNITKNFIQENDCIELNTKISLYFSYNGTLTKGVYYFKFVGVLQEPTYDIVQKSVVETFWNIRDISLRNEYINEYNERRNMNITGRVALVQINVLNNIKVFCDEKYIEFFVKSKEGKLIACGEGNFYDVENMNEITQLNLGKNYYFDKEKNIYTKCHEKCQTCSRKFNDTNMNCDLCIENFYIRDDNCLEIPKCEYNYYYDKNLNLKCLNIDEHCPDFKPYENIKTKECIQNCSIYEYNKECGPTNNINAIKDTYKNILDNAKYLNLEEILFIKKIKYILYGNNVTFIFSTSEIEKNELNNNYNSSSIILNELENNIKQNYSINKEMPIPILKIEIINSYSNDIQLYYALFDPKNFTKKLDLNLFPQNYIEIRKPYNLKPYKTDVILKTKNLGYNIFDLNDSFYNDICSVFSYNDTDFSLSERKNILDLSDEKLCQNILNDSCDFSNFDINTLRSICFCKINSVNNYISEIKNNDIIEENKTFINLVKDNINFLKSSNIRVVKCFSIIFRKNLFTENYGFYIMFFLLLLNCLTIFYSPISKIDKKLNKFCKTVLTKMEKIYNKDNNDDLKDKTFDLSETKIMKNNSVKIKNNTVNKIENSNEYSQNEISNEKLDPSFKSDKINNSNILFDKNNKIEEETLKKLRKKNNSDFFIYKVIKNNELAKRKEYLSEYEMGNLSYKYALLIEDRDNSNYYFALLKQNNKIILTFLNNDDYNIKSIKISLFILEFVLSLTVNAFFYNDKVIYEMNQEKEDTSVTSKYLRIIYSAIISGILNFIIELLAFSHKKIIRLKTYKEIKDAKKYIPKLIKKLKTKYIIYYVLSLFLNIIFLYYITSFCAIYTIIQISMIKDATISFLLMMSYTIILSLISSIIRIFSLKKNNKFRHFLYIISWLFSLI